MSRHYEDYGDTSDFINGTAMVHGVTFQVSCGLPIAESVDWEELIEALQTEIDWADAGPIFQIIGTSKVEPWGYSDPGPELGAALSALLGEAAVDSVHEEVMA